MTDLVFAGWEEFKRNRPGRGGINMSCISEKLLLLLVVLFHATAREQLLAQRTLNPGEDWSCHFVLEDNWLRIGPSPTAPAGGANGQFAATLNANLTPGTVLRCEFYEGLYFGAPTDGLPLSTYFYTSAPPNTITGWVANAWQDFEGTVRFTALTGPTTIQFVDLEMDSRSFFPQMWEYYYLSVVPPAAPPRLSISPLTNSVRLSWWTNVSSGYVLQTANALTGASWATVNKSATLSNGQKFVTFSTTTNPGGVFRLRK